MLNFIKRFSQTREARRFERDGLNIIQDINADAMISLLTEEQDQGWELRSVYPISTIGKNKWEGKLCKGASALHCKWDASHQGSIVGIKRIVQPLAAKHKLVCFDSPNYSD